MSEIMELHFIQIDRCNAGVRLTCRVGPDRTGETLGTLVRQPYMSDEVWNAEMRRWLGLQQIWADSPVRSWKDNAYQGTVEDLVAGRIDEQGDHG